MWWLDLWLLGAAGFAMVSGGRVWGGWWMTVTVVAGFAMLGMWWLVYVCIFECLCYIKHLKKNIAYKETCMSPFI